MKLRRSVTTAMELGEEGNQVAQMAWLISGENFVGKSIHHPHMVAVAW